MNIVKVTGLAMVAPMALASCGTTSNPPPPDSFDTACETFDTGPECIGEAGCAYPADDGTCETLVIHVGDPSCEDNVWDFVVTGQGDPAAAALTWTEEASSTTPWDEADHYFTGSTNTFSLALDVVATPGEVVQATDGLGKTLFACANNDGATMTYRVDLYDIANTLTDCLIWGQDAVAIYGSECFHCPDCAG